MAHHTNKSAPLLALLLGVALITPISGTARAAEPAFAITPMAGYRAGGKFLDGASAPLDVQAASSLALAFNWRASEPGAQYELLYSRQSSKTDSATPVDLKFEYLQLGGTTVVGDPLGRAIPFAAGGLGATRVSPADAALSNETRWSVNLGGGVRVPVANHVQLRFEARGYLTWIGGSSSLFCDSGCAIAAKGNTFFQYEALGGVSISF